MKVKRGPIANAGTRASGEESTERIARSMADIPPGCVESLIGPHPRHVWGPEREDLEEPCIYCGCLCWDDAAKDPCPKRPIPDEDRATGQRIGYDGRFGSPGF